MLTVVKLLQHFLFHRIHIVDDYGLPLEMMKILLKMSVPGIGWDSQLSCNEFHHIKSIYCIFQPSNKCFVKLLLLFTCTVNDECFCFDFRQVKKVQRTRKCSNFEQFQKKKSSDIITNNEIIVHAFKRNMTSK